MRVGQEPELDLQEAVFGVDRGGLAPLDRPGMEGFGTQKTVGRIGGAEAQVILVQGGEDPTHLSDRVPPHIGTGPVAGPPPRPDRGPEKALVGGCQGEARGLRHHHRIGGEPSIQKVAEAQGGMLFVGGEHKGQRAAMRASVARHRCRHRKDGREARLHVGGSTPEQAAVADLGTEGREGHGRDTHRVEVAAEPQNRAPFPQSSHQVDPTRLGLGPIHGEAPRLQVGNEEVRCRTLAVPPSFKGGIHRGDSHQRPGPGHRISTEEIGIQRRRALWVRVRRTRRLRHRTPPVPWSGRGCAQPKCARFFSM